MTSPSARLQARERLTEFISQALVPHEIQRRVEKALGVRANPKVMDRALKSTQEKARRIMEHISEFNSQAFGLSVAGPDLFELILLGEYAWQHALAGEKAAKRYVPDSAERPEETLLFCLNMLGFFKKRDLEPYRNVMRSRIKDGDKLWRTMSELLASDGDNP